ncbi:MAG: radical SAM protein [Treponema sp.]|jgi:MoaA/NifB/PqqE/SkfB family radical SAM enzyme|nr:radical SAM protein [Treponema sp.]
MKTSYLLRLTLFGLSTIIFKRRKPILGTIIVTDKCNLTCKHCAVNNINGAIYPYRQIKQEMNILYQQGVRILFFCGGETFLWSDQNKTIRDLVVEAKQMGFFIVNVVTNGTYTLDLPEADLILLSLDGNRVNHNLIRGNTFDTIIKNIREAASSNICLYMAVNTINLSDIQTVSEIAKQETNVRAVSFNFHTSYPGTEYLSLSKEQKRERLDEIALLIKQKYPIFNLKSAFSAIADNSFTTPCYQCVVMENGRQSICGRCVDIEGLCEKCGYFFAAEYSMLFHGSIKTGLDMLWTYLKYL